MEGFKKGFQTTSQKKERKPELNLGQSSLTQLQPSSQQFQQPGIQQNYEERKQTQKDTHALTPLSEEKPRKQVKSVLHQEVSEFNPSGQMSMEQFIKVLLNLQEEVKKLRKENTKLTEFINNGFQDTIDLRMANQEREIDTLLKYQREQLIQTTSQLEESEKQNQKIESEFQSQNQKILSQKFNQFNKMETEQNQIIQMQTQKIQKKKTNCYCCLKEGYLLQYWKF